MGANDLGGDREPQTASPFVATAVGIEPYEALEYALAVDLRYAGAGVFHGNVCRLIVEATTLDSHGASARCVAQRVADDVGEYLSHTRRIDGDRRRFAGRSE